VQDSAKGAEKDTSKDCFDWLDGCGADLTNTLQNVTLEQLDSEEDQTDETACSSVLVLLKTELSAFTPHVVHLTALSQGSSLLIVSQIGRSRLSGGVMSLIESVSAVPRKNCNIQVIFFSLCDFVLVNLNLN